MTRFRSRWLALFGGVTLIALSLSSAWAAKPDGPNHGQQVSAFVHSLLGDVEETDEAVDEETEPEEDTEVAEGGGSAHGKCVSGVAHSDEVGPPNDNHGGAVSEAARVTCWEDTSSEESTGEESADDEGETDVEADESEESKHGNGHGHGRGGDSSDS